MKSRLLSLLPDARVTITLSLPRLVAVVLIAAVIASALIGVRVFTTQAAQCSQWYHCPISQRYGQNYEHGVDLLTHGLAITALRSGTITFDRWECWNDECVQDITWRLDFPSHACNSPFMYVQINRAVKGLHVGEHVSDWQLLGYSGSFFEIGLTSDREYGVSGWHWGVNILKCFPYL
jgi:hypothetical protein